MNKMINTKRVNSGASRKGKYTRKQISEAIQKWTRVLESMDEAEQLDFVAPGKYTDFIAPYDELAVVSIYFSGIESTGESTCIICEYKHAAAYAAHCIYEILESMDDHAAEASYAENKDRCLFDLKENTRQLMTLIKRRADFSEQSINYKMDLTGISSPIEVDIEQLPSHGNLIDLRIALSR